MKLAIVALTAPGAATARRLAAAWPDADLYLPASHLGEQERDGGRRLHLLPPRPGAVFPDLFARYRGLVCVTATGIAVRWIAPCLQDKRTDPAVVVVDDAGIHAVSLLSGHLGGANALARAVAAVLGGTAVITTATDVHGLPALDLVAAALGWAIEPAGAAKTFSVAMINGAEAGAFVDPDLDLTGFAGVPLAREFFARCPPRPLAEIGAFLGERPERRREGGTAGSRAAVAVTTREIEPDPGRTAAPLAILRPRTIYAGIGCKQGIPEEVIAEALARALRAAGRSPASVAGLASTDRKRGEPGLLAAAAALDLPLRFYTLDELRACDGRYRPSAFVRQAIGVGGVCEPSALLAAGQPARLILPKMAWSGVTVALAEAACGLSASAPGTATR